MESFMELLKTDTFLLIMFGIMVILLITTILTLTKVIYLSTKYKNFMEKLGKGKNIEEDLCRNCQPNRNYRKRFGNLYKKGWNCKV